MHSYQVKTQNLKRDPSKSSLHSADKKHLLENLIRLNVFSPQKRNAVEKYFPFFDKALLPLIDYLTIRDLLQLAGYDDNDVPLFAVLLCMFDSLQEGSLCLNIEKDSLTKRLLVFAQPDAASDTAEKFLDAIDKHQYDDFICRDQDHYKPLVLSYHPGGKLLYFQKYYVYEKKLQQKLNRLLDLAGSARGDAFRCQVSDKLIDEIFTDDSVLRISKDGPPIAKDPYQVEAIRLALCSSFCIVSGGPGTGKTSLLVNMLRCFLRTGIDPSQIILCAPTGRAAQRMTEAIYSNVKTIRYPGEYENKLLNLKASTIHKTLHFKKYLNGFYYQEQNPLSALLIIMDEVSMVDVVLMEKFMRAIDPFKTRLVLLGDKDQLPPVDAGAVFGTMIPRQDRASAFKDHLVILKNTYRSGNRLRKLAGLINEGKSPSVEPVTFQDAMAIENDQWAMVYPKTVDQWQKDLIQWANRHLIKAMEDQQKFSDSPANAKRKADETAHSEEISGRGTFYALISRAGSMDSDNLINASDSRPVLDKIFQTLESSRILTLIRQGIWGSSGINQFLSGYLSDRFQSFSDWQKYGVFSGAFIIIVKNDYAKNLFNGDTGVVIKNPRGVLRAYFKRFDTYTGFSIDLLPAWEPAYALTVHKCQGSEFDDILLVLPADEQHRLLTRQMIYTAVTRAKKRVIIYGKPSSFNVALKSFIHRESGLSCCNSG
ncbi:MAG: exodeoxyribonuclease V subunit alpha [Desulfobacterales bacterium]